MPYFNSGILDSITNADLSYYEINFILLEVLGRSLEDVRIKGISPQELEKVKPYIEAARRYPVEYIFRKAFFRNLVLYVDERVLIPRNETEHLVDIALRLIGERGLERILEVGTGSGAIAISIATEGGRPVFASDLSSGAIQVASMNVRSSGAADRVFLFVGDRLEAVGGKWDLIIWNHPYVLPEEYHSLPPKVKVEPEMALVSTPDTLIEFLKEAMEHLSDRGFVLLESSRPFIRKIMEDFPRARIERDIYGMERFVLIERR